jgi:hypothetical protein
MLRSILALVGAFGLFGAISKKTGLVSLFGSMLAFHLGFSIATGVFTIYTLFKRNSDEALANCVNGSTDQNVIDGCKEGLKILKIVIVVVYVVTWLVELCGSATSVSGPTLTTSLRRLPHCYKLRQTAQGGRGAHWGGCQPQRSHDRLWYADCSLHVPNSKAQLAPPTNYAFTQPVQSHGHQV